MQLRDYQLAATAAARSTWKRASRNALIVLPTGTGKTMTALSEVAKAAEAGRRVLWLGHREELVEQPFRALCGVWGHLAGMAGIVQAGQDECDRLVVFASTDTLRVAARLERYLSHGVPTLVVADEAHHYVLTNSYGRLLVTLDERGEAAGSGKPYKIGLTATPDRADRKSLATYWKLSKSYSIMRAFDAGYLVVPTFEVAPLPGLNLDDVKTGEDGDFNSADLGAKMLKADVVPHTVETLGKHRGRRVIVFTANVEQAKETAEALQADGWAARWLSGETAPAVRKRLVAGLADGTIDVICNCDVLTEGTDIPPVNCVVVARPTRSRGRYMQAIGRGLRTYPGKEDCLIIDIVGASAEHKMIVAPVLLEEERKKQDKREELQPGAKVESPDHDWGVGIVKETDEDNAIVVEWPVSAAFPEGAIRTHTLEEIRSYSGPGQKREREPGKHWEWKRPARAAWVRVRDLTSSVWAVDCGSDHGLVAIVDEGRDDLWNAVLLPKRGAPVPLADGPVPFELARGLGEDVARQANQLTHGKARWRTGPATDKQVGLLRKFQVDVGQLEAAGDRGLTAGDAADAITEQLAKRAVASKGLAVRTDKAL